MSEKRSASGLCSQIQLAIEWCLSDIKTELAIHAALRKEKHFSKSAPILENLKSRRKIENPNSGLENLEYWYQSWTICIFLAVFFKLNNLLICARLFIERLASLCSSVHWRLGPSHGP